MTKLCDRLQPWFPKIKPQTGEYGIEIETETVSDISYPDDFLRSASEPTGHKYMKTPHLKQWVGHYDNSLRNFGVEFVFKEALTYKQSLAALDDFAVKTKGIKFIENAPSTSVHVHWNVFNETFLTLANFLTVYSMYETLMISYCGPLRRSNLFALPMRVAEHTVTMIVKMLKGFGNGSLQGCAVSDHSAKYAALNISTISRLGSLEIRSMRGTTNVDEIKSWLGMINRMVEFSRQESLTPSKILDMYRDDSTELFTMVFGQYTDDLRESAKTDPDHGFDYLIEKNLWYAKEISESIVDWSVFNKCMDETYNKWIEQQKLLEEKVAKKKASLSQYAQAITTLGQGAWVDSDLVVGAGVPQNTPQPIQHTQPAHHLEDPIDQLESMWDQQESEEQEDTSSW